MTVPPGTGRVISAASDFDGGGSYAGKIKLSLKPVAAAKLSTTHIFATPGTYFVAVKVVSKRTGNANGPYAHILNRGRVRVVVE